ncbi:MAG: hypothetical protein LBC39_07190 [Methanobrevibacter sp.]|jgi:hypothetical protein|nr:hypothetical protein [Candidatus Methanovirga aequatorialis]
MNELIDKLKHKRYSTSFKSKKYPNDICLLEPSDETFEKIGDWVKVEKENMRPYKCTDQINPFIKCKGRYDDIFSVSQKILFVDFINTTQLSRNKRKLPLKKIAGHISNINEIENRLKNGDKELPNEIVDIKDVDYNPFSFATKFCRHANRDSYGEDDYVIYDSFVVKILPYYLPEEIEKTTFLDTHIRKKRNYKKLTELSEIFYKEYDITVKNKNWLFDLFLWGQFNWSGKWKVETEKIKKKEKNINT